MRLRAIEIADFRNIQRALVEAHRRFNVLSGDNGQGKTNFLEALYLIGTLVSFRANRVEELVRFGASGARVRARLERGELERLYELEIAGEPLRKATRVDGKGVRASADHFGGFNVVLFAPDDLGLLRGSPGGRRRYLDRAVWNAEPAILKEARTYQHVLRSRNALVRDPALARRSDGLLDIYDRQLAVAGAAIMTRRNRFLDALAPHVSAAFDRISRSGLPVSLRYSSTPELMERSKDEAGNEGLVASFMAALRLARPRDFERGHTSVGPHTDDFELDLDGRPARLFASQGQLRALMLALKIGEIERLELVVGEPPVLLLDDVSSELDRTRNENLFEFLRQIDCQVFITTTHPDHVPVTAERRDFSTVGGEVRLLQPPLSC